MGRASLREVLATPGVELSGGVERPGHPAVGEGSGRPRWPRPHPAGRRRRRGRSGRRLAGGDRVLDPGSDARQRLQVRRAGLRAHVIGTTGLEGDQERELRHHAARTAIVWAPNMSVGVNLLLGLVEQVARTLDPAFDIEILEMHHRQKVDAPSGTALALGRAAARGRGSSSTRSRSARAMASPAPAAAARSALRCCEAGTWSATTA